MIFHQTLIVTKSTQLSETHLRTPADFTSAGWSRFLLLSSGFPGSWEHSPDLFLRSMTLLCPTPFFQLSCLGTVIYQVFSRFLSVSVRKNIFTFFERIFNFCLGCVKFLPMVKAKGLSAVICRVIIDPHNHGTGYGKLFNELNLLISAIIQKWKHHCLTTDLPQL